MQNIYIPHNNTVFNQFFKGITQYVVTKTSGEKPEWTHIPQMHLSYITNVYIKWNDVYDLSLSPPHSLEITKEIDYARTTTERALITFINRFLLEQPVTDFDRDNMGIMKCKSRTPRIEANEVVEMELKLRNIRDMLVDFWNSDSTPKENRVSPS